MLSNAARIVHLAALHDRSVAKDVAQRLANRFATVGSTSSSRREANSDLRPEAHEKRRNTACVLNLGLDFVPVPISFPSNRARCLCQSSIVFHVKGVVARRKIEDPLNEPRDRRQTRPAKQEVEQPQDRLAKVEFVRAEPTQE